MAINKEKLDYIATVAEIVAAVGVMISVIYLAIQIDAGNKELRAQSYNDALANMHEPLELLVQDRELSEIVRKGNLDPESLTEAERYRFLRWHLLRFDAYEYTYYANKSDSVTPELWHGMDSSFSHDIREYPGIRQFWEEYRHAFAEPFNTYVQEKVDDSNR